MKKEKEQLLKIIDRFQQKTITVWGDLILDEYLYGTTRRISREAPVLIIRYRSKELSLGGGGNSLLNLKALGANPVPVGVVGKDDSGKRILKILKQLGMSIESVLIEKAFQTPIKTRILAGEESTRKQQVLRIDKEAKVPETNDLKKRLLNSLRKAHHQTDALLISDYNYFTVKEDLFRKILPRLKKSRKPVALDSRFRLTDFEGVTVLTPNEPEVEHALHIELKDNKEMVRKAGRRLLNRTKAEAVLITRGSKGMVLFERRRPPLVIPIHGSTDIVDVTGAGDTVISVFTLALTCGATFKQAAQLANYAGGIVVMKKGTATLSPQELKEAIGS
ncbi:MAG: bifunctional ADP-heptose synthase [Candidatus Aminicenantes bacterium]|nr:bifunctional ADP-heptose synthase [Candidatus Aminicenantes bacterium]MDH5386276.1 bifunctional ADP-heptose synthase [Candidatus Aminicenantes bacterium]MDH5742600.1 bifunctional ADP-heptose synthase [Candidatus Aminicenantes bacterium]